MKKLLFLICIAATQANAQTTIPNLNFEDWTLSSSGRFNDPNPSTIWATPNYAMDLILGNPSTSIVQKSSDMHGGSFAALMKSRTIVGSFVGATLFTGSLDASIPFSPVPKLGVPFTGRPISMQGWYKYTSVNNDSSSIYILLSKWNTTTNQRDIIGFKEKRDYATVSSYTPFELEIDYTSSNIPDSITIVFSASAGAENNLGEVGSSLWVDDVNLNYFPLGTTKAKINSSAIYPNPCHNYLNLRGIDYPFDYTLFSLSGQILSTEKQCNLPIISTEKLPLGCYWIQIENKSAKISEWHSFLKN